MSTRSSRLRVARARSGGPDGSVATGWTAEHAVAVCAGGDR